MKPKLLTDLETCINILLSGNLTDMEINDTIGILRRCMVEYEGIDTIWSKDMTDYQKAKIMKERGFSLTRVSYGLRIDYLGYHLWDLTKQEIEELLL